MANPKLLKMLKDLEMMLPPEAIDKLKEIEDIVNQPEGGKPAAEPAIPGEEPMLPEEPMPEEPMM